MYQYDKHLDFQALGREIKRKREAKGLTHVNTNSPVYVVEHFLNFVVINHSRNWSYPISVTEFFITCITFHLS